jgi:flagellin
VQATTGTNSETDLASIQAEITQRLEEINRVSEQTQFNGVKVLAKDQSLSIQVGANDGETISVDLKQIDSGTLNLKDLDVSKLARAFNSSEYVAAGGTSATADVTVNYTGTGKILATGTGTNTEYFILDEGKVYEADATNSTTVDSITFTKGAAVTEPETLSQVAPLAAIDKAIQDVDNLRSDLGAVQNRFESTIANLNNTITNLSSSRSRIEDADYAIEVSNMTRAQILQQAGTSVLAQANQVPQTVLSLLR